MSEVVKEEVAERCEVLHFFLRVCHAADGKISWFVSMTMRKSLLNLGNAYVLLTHFLLAFLKTAVKSVYKEIGRG